MNRPTFHCIALFAAIVLTARAGAAGHPDVTVLRMGSGQITKDKPEDSWRLPMGANGPLPQALVLMGKQPKAAKEFRFPMSQPADPDAPPEMEQVPATIKFTIAGQELPPWNLHPFVTAYVINLDVIRRNPEYATGRMAIKAVLESRADQFDFAVFAMPDPLLLNETLNGPIAAFYDAASDPEIKAYFKALAFEIGGDNVNALLEYRKLAQSQNETLARIARRGVRLFGFETRPRKLSGNFMEHWRWALYLQQCSLFGPAFGEFNECRVIYPLHAESQFRAGEMLDRLDANQFKQLPYMERCYEASFPKKVSPWYTLLVILESRQNKSIPNDRLFDIKGDWIVVQRMVEAATGGAVRIITTTHEFKDETAHAFRTYPGGVHGPKEDLVGDRGWFDSVIFIRPRVATDKEPNVLTAGGDSGPKGAAISCLYDDAGWKEMFQAWYQHYTWAAHVGEIGEGYPAGDDLWDCGHQPVPHETYSLRAALRYNFTPAMALRPKMTDLCSPGNHVRLWQIKGPFPVRESGNSSEPLRHHVLDPINSGPSLHTVTVVSDADFVDLAKLLGKSGAALAEATTWVYSPIDQDVRMWIGQNDGLAAWLNGCLIHEGRYYSAGNYEDKNLVDTVAAHAPLKAGWNELRLVVEAWPSPRDKGWGFSVRFCDFNGQALPGLAYLNEPPAEGLVPKYTPPKAGEHYLWRDVKKDYQEFLPRLTATDLQRITGIPNLAIDFHIEKAGGFFALAAPDRKASATYRVLSTTWQPGKDQDVAVNNVLDWDREACAALAYQKDGKARDLLFVKPEALTAYVTLLNEPADAKSTFANRPRDERFLGYVVIPVASSSGDLSHSVTSRTLLVLDTFIGDEVNWPRDEEDLMNPIAPYVPNPPDPRPRP
ncbi:MAG TPA: hypothetical protein VJZ71_01120 [Phycisphaerae bacterium]|nr:hypothetical protein [Phycisphaerae bacterium]